MNIDSLLKIKAANPDGSMHQELFNLLTQIIQQLQMNLSDEGYKLPQQTTANINLLNTAKSEGAILYDKELKKGFLNINGVFKEILTS